MAALPPPTPLRPPPEAWGGGPSLCGIRPSNPLPINRLLSRAAIDFLCSPEGVRQARALSFSWQSTIYNCVFAGSLQLRDARGLLQAFLPPARCRFLLLQMGDCSLRPRRPKVVSVGRPAPSPWCVPSSRRASRLRHLLRSVASIRVRWGQWWCQRCASLNGRRVVRCSRCRFPACQNDRRLFARRHGFAAVTSSFWVQVPLPVVQRSPYSDESYMFFGSIRLPWPGPACPGTRGPPFSVQVPQIYSPGDPPHQCSSMVGLPPPQLPPLLPSPRAPASPPRRSLACPLSRSPEGLKTAIIEGDVVGGTCVNRGCVPSKALLAVSGRMREFQSENHLKSLGLKVSSPGYDRQAVADHANNLASAIRGNLTNSLKALGVDILTGVGSVVGPQTVKYGKVGFPDTTVTAKDIIIATGSVPFVPNGIEIDGKTVFTSDHALKLEWVPDWIAIVGSGYIGLEFSDVYTSLGSEVTFIEALDQLMPAFDPDIRKLAQRVLINPRKIDFHTGMFVKKITPAKDGKPVIIELIDAKTKEPKDTLEVDAALIATGRAPFTKGLGLENVPNLYCIGDANGKMMLAHAASAQGISVVEQICGKDNVLNHMSIPAACFTHPEISMVGLTETSAREKAEKEGFEISVTKTSFKANTKALAENEGEGLAKLIYRPDTGEILGVHILGLHAADLIHEASNAIAMGTRIQELKFAVHAHPTLSEVLDELFKAAKVNVNAYSSVSEPVAA